MYPFPLQIPVDEVFLPLMTSNRLPSPQTSKNIYTTAETEETRGLYRFSSYSGRASLLKRVTSSWLLSEVAIGASRSTSSRERRMEQEADRGRVYHHSAAYRPGAATGLSYRSVKWKIKWIKQFSYAILHLTHSTQYLIIVTKTKTTKADVATASVTDVNVK